MEFDHSCRLSSTVTSEDYEEDDDILLPGFRFHPTDEELVGFYLKRKVEKKPLRIDLIKHIDVYKYEPWDLPKEASCSAGEREWYFFCRRGRKYKNSIRPNRVTRSGFWKATGIDKPIYSVGRSHYCIGLKKSLVYYRGSAGKGTKTDWMMHEFRLPASDNPNPIVTDPEDCNIHEAEVWTLCRIFRREAPFNKKYLSSKQQSASSTSSSPLESDSRRQNDESSEVSADHKVSEQGAPEECCFYGDQYLSFTNQVPFTTSSYLSFSNHQNGDDQFLNENWDELRPMVEFALDPSMLYSIT